MSNPLHLITGQKYMVVKAFTDYDKLLHPIGETWTFVRTDFIPYDDGLSLHVTMDNIQKKASYRFQWREEEQAHIIRHFNEYVKLLTN